MQILTVDIGTGTQDVLLFDTERAPENCLKLVMPAPTLLIGEQIRCATNARLPLLITGVTMGGGPCAWAAEAHRRAGLRVIATPDAARTFNDDLEQVQHEMGVEVVAEETARTLLLRDEVAHVPFRDFDFFAIRDAFAAFGLDLHPDAIAVAVFDHGAAPPGVSDRQFRMDYLVDRLRQERRLSTFAFRRAEVPSIMTRLRAAADTAATQSGLPVIAMDTAPAAILGAQDDHVVASRPDAMIVNVGNFHTLAFQFQGGQFVRLFEHHTGLLTPDRLVEWLEKLADGRIAHESVFADHGHGALALDHQPVPLAFVAVVGPRRAMLRHSRLPSYFAVPHGDQMLVGCFGMLRACADIEPAWHAAVETALTGNADRPLW